MPVEVGMGVAFEVSNKLLAPACFALLQLSTAGLSLEVAGSQQVQSANSLTLAECNAALVRSSQTLSAVSATYTSSECSCLHRQSGGERNLFGQLTCCWKGGCACHGFGIVGDHPYILQEDAL